METVRSLINCGVDDLIRKPLSVTRLTEGIEKFTRSRRPFVTSYDYVGPTRRAAKRDNEEPGGLIYVPNTLRSKVVNNLSDSELQRMVDVALIELEDKQLEARGFEASRLADRLCAAYEESALQSDKDELLDRLYAVSNELFRRSEGTTSHQVANLAKMIQALVVRIRSGRLETVGTEVQLISKLSLVIRRALTVERNAVELMEQIVDTVAGYSKTH